jgi:hypothetical protein
MSLSVLSDSDTETVGMIALLALLQAPESLLVVSWAGCRSADDALAAFMALLLFAASSAATILATELWMLVMYS